MNRTPYTKVLCNLKLGGYEYRRVPFVLDQWGRPLESINSFVRDRLLKNWVKESHTTDLKVGRIIRFLMLLSKNNRSWDEPTHDYIALYVRDIENDRSSSDTINAHTSSIYEFYWYCEEKGFCKNIIGINNIDKNDYKYPLHVFPSRNPHKKYDNPFARRGSHKTLRSSITKDVDWQVAYEKALDCGTTVSLRDAALIHFILRTGARRIEVVSLTIDQFRDEIKPGQTQVILTLRKTKNHDSRDLVVPAEAYLEVKEFINEERPDMISNRRRDKHFVFCGSGNNGAALTVNYVSGRLRDTYGVAPHDGRSTFATNLMIELYRKGHSMESAMLIVRQRMGHSASDETSRTLRAFYLQAEAIVRAQEKGTELERARKEIADMRSNMATQEHEIEVLRRQVASLTKRSSSAG